MIGEVPFSGRLREVHLSSILYLLQRRQLTGILRVRLNDLDKSLYIKEGEIIFATSKYPDDRLGLLLLKTGKLTYTQFETVVRIYEASVLTSHKSGLRQGTILVDQGFLTPKELYDAVIAQVKEIILGLFTWIDGEYEFIEGPLPSQEVITLKISTAALILEGIRRVTDWTWLAGGLPPFTCRLRLTKDPRDLFQFIPMQPNETALLSRLNGQTIRELLLGAPLPALDTLRLIYFFLSAGFAEAAESSDAPASSYEERESITQQIIVEEIGATLHRKEADSPPSIEQIRESYRKMDAQNYYELLGVPMHATREEIKRAYYRLAKAYHPDRHFEASMQEVKKELEALFAKIKEAYDILNSDPKRASYNESLSKPRRRSEPEPFRVEKQAEGSFQEGREAYEAKDYKRAVELFETAARLVPENHLYFGYLGKALLHFPERIRRAEMALRQALMLNPNEVDYYTELARIYEGQGLIRRAIREYEEGLKRDPQNRVIKEGLSRLKAKTSV
jgi:curved DNA-binding protein CbpA